MTTIVITPEYVATDRKVIVARPNSIFRTEYKDKIVVSSCNEFALVATGQFNYDITSDDLSKLNSTIKTLMACYELNLKKEEKYVKELKELMVSLNQEILETTKESIEGINLYSEATYIITRKHLIVIGVGTEEEPYVDLDGKFLGKPKANASWFHIEPTIPLPPKQKQHLGGSMMLLEDLHNITDGSGYKYAKLALKLNNNDVEDAVNFTVHCDPLSGLDSFKVPKLEIKSLKPMKKLALSKLKKLFIQKEK